MAKMTTKKMREAALAVIASLLESGDITDNGKAELEKVFASQSSTHPKINEKGEVWCNYFGEYLPEEEFNVNSKGKIDSMSKEGKKLHRAQRSAVNRANSDVIAQFRAGDISADEMSELLGLIEQNANHRYPHGTDDIPEDYPFEV